MSRASPMTAIKPFRIAISDDVLTDLKSRLARTRWPEAELVDDLEPGRAAGMDPGNLHLLG
ncbi:hypothetical protein ACVWZ6_008495 [Bradyrhizobium sp. GM6.1]